MKTGGYLGSTYLTAGNYKYNTFVAADFAAAGIENQPYSIPVHGYTGKSVNKGIDENSIGNFRMFDL
ncbi:hypothetical protein [Niastella populi]|uniref:Uncharacterized protein n=1 Tax=Niastella populi TaxID=550983 RepID=A0A1V9F569_9BACT|nr:hypothetical protein [Niastella populi]OQP53528.1 hypothetical protein A4R26_05985 [Niastella populi]